MIAMTKVRLRVIRGSSTQTTGGQAELAAAHFLQEHGLKRVEENFRCKLGELDLIMQDKSCLVFIEVRFRKSERYGSAASTVTTAKQNKLRKTALYYLKARRLRHTAVRFDVVGMKPGEQAHKDYQFRWIKNAF
ncbi:MAG: YraN family protein [Pseudomonadota bacterium]